MKTSKKSLANKYRILTSFFNKILSLHYVSEVKIDFLLTVFTMLMQAIDVLLDKRTYAQNFCLKCIPAEILFSPIGFPHPLKSILSIKRKKKTLQTIIEPIPINQQKLKAEHKTHTKK